jgi:hypothetical protein
MGLVPAISIPSRTRRHISRQVGESAGATFSQFLSITRNMPQFEGTGANREESSSVDCAISYFGRSDMRRAYAGSRAEQTTNNDRLSYKNADSFRS